MRKSILIISFIFLTTNLFSQKLTLDEVEKDLQKTYKKILLNRIETDTINWGLLESENKIFREKIINYTSNYPSTLTYSFDSLKKEKIDIVSSEDKLFRIYSWETWLGGTMRDFGNVFQYKLNDIVCAIPNDTEPEINKYDYYTPFYSEIFTLKSNTKTYYLAVYNGIYSTKDCSQSIQIFTIENDTLNNNVKLIKTKKGLVSSIDVYFDFFSVAERPERPLRLIKYDKEKKIIYIPIVVEDGKVTNRYILYQFNGKYFEHIETQKPKPKNKT
ncbi:hypothetical protein AB3G33_11130 [Flavobacterium sp. WC2421]|uniref:hypothetical protein n=1 Tax=Flavobacterium sp. WC2421 TaxID=3234138 RepID=UPI0034679DB9